MAFADDFFCWGRLGSFFRRFASVVVVIFVVVVVVIPVRLGAFLPRATCRNPTEIRTLGHDTILYLPGKAK